MARCLLIAALLLLGGCATQERYQAMLQTWLGASEPQLVADWGPPDSVYENEERRYLTWTKQYQSYLRGTPPTYYTHVVGDRLYTSAYGGSPGMIVNSRCKTTFVLEQATVVAWRVEGNACRA